MGTRKQQQNNLIRKIISSTFFEEDHNSKHAGFRLDTKMVELGSIAAMDPNFSLDNVSDEIRNDKDYRSYVAGFERTKRLLKIQNDLYLLGIEYFNMGISLEEIPDNYKNNEYFMSGYNGVKKK